MNKPVGKPEEEPRSLLRRLLRKADGTPSTGPGETPAAPAPVITPPPKPPTGNLKTSTSKTGTLKPGTLKSDTGDLSPVRPPAPPEGESPTPIAPRKTQPLPAVTPPTPATIEDRLKAETALQIIREKTAQVAQEYASGKLNRAQFLAMYAHYNEKRTIIEKLLARDPGTSAWQSVAKPGHTTFLRSHFEARVLSYAIYDQARKLGQLVTSHGQPILDEAMSSRLVMAIAMLSKSHKNLAAQRKEIGNGNWAVFVPGVFTTSIIVFSLEPSSSQITMVQDLHRDFERANRLVLARGIFEPDHLVFPHRSLFERSKNTDQLKP